MGKKFWRVISVHWKDNLLLYMVIILFLLLGIFAGALGAKTLSSKQEGELIEYLNRFAASFTSVEVEPGILVRQSLLTNLKLLGIVWFLGLTVLGAPLILLVIAAKGFYLGFTAGFLIQEKGMAGILLTALALLPQNIFNLPALVAAGVTAASFSFWLFKGRVKERNKKLSQQFLIYTLLLGSLAGFILLGSLLEAYLTPQLIKMVIMYI